MNRSLSRSGKQPKPPKVCLTLPIPLIGPGVWLQIVGEEIYGPFPAPGIWEWPITVTPNRPDLPMGAAVPTDVQTDLPNVIEFLFNRIATPIVVKAGTPGIVVQFQLRSFFPPSVAEYFWYARFPLHPAP